MSESESESPKTAELFPSQLIPKKTSTSPAQQLTAKGGEIFMIWTKCKNMLRWSGQNANQKVGRDKMPTTEISPDKMPTFGWHYVRLASCPIGILPAHLLVLAAVSANAFIPRQTRLQVYISLVSSSRNITLFFQQWLSRKFFSILLWTYSYLFSLTYLVFRSHIYVMLTSVEFGQQQILKRRQGKYLHLLGQSRPMAGKA